jgi:hypothetical protein
VLEVSKHPSLRHLDGTQSLHRLDGRVVRRRQQSPHVCPQHSDEALTATDAAVLRDPSHPREKLLRCVVRRRTDRLKLPLGAAVATPCRLVTREGVSVPFALGEVDVDADGNDSPDVRGVLCGSHRGKCGAKRKSDHVETIHLQSHAESIDHGPYVGHKPSEVDRRGIGAARPARSALIPVRDYKVRLEVQSLLDRACLVDERQPRPLLHE